MSWQTVVLILGLVFSFVLLIGFGVFAKSFRDFDRDIDRKAEAMRRTAASRRVQFPRDNPKDSR